MSKGKHTCGYCREDFHERCTNLACVAGYWNVYSTNPEECEEHGDPIEQRCNRSYSIGQVAYAEDMVEAFLKEAGEFFARHQDDKAQFLREIAESMKAKAAKLRKEHHEKYPKERA